MRVARSATEIPIPEPTLKVRGPLISTEPRPKDGLDDVVEIAVVSHRPSIGNDDFFGAPGLTQQGTDE